MMIHSSLFKTGIHTKNESRLLTLAKPCEPENDHDPRPNWGGGGGNARLRGQEGGDEDDGDRDNDGSTELSPTDMNKSQPLRQRQCAPQLALKT